MEEFGREMYKLHKTFNAKAKQFAKEQAKVGGAKDKVGGAKDEGQEVYAPLKMTNTIQESIKQFKVYMCIDICIMYGVECSDIISADIHQNNYIDVLCSQVKPLMSVVTQSFFLITGVSPCGSRTL